MCCKVFLYILIWTLIYGPQVTRSQDGYPGDDELDLLPGEIMADESFMLPQSTDQYEMGSELGSDLSDIDDTDIIEQDISGNREYPEDSNSQTSLDEENAAAQLDLVQKLLEMEEADDTSYVHVYSLENGMLKEEELPDDTAQDGAKIYDEVDDNMNDDASIDDDVEDENKYEIEAMLSAGRRWVDLLSPQRSLQIDKRQNQEKIAVVDILAIIDYSLYRIFLARYDHDKARTMIEIRKYYTIMVAMANERYSTIRIPGMSIKLVLSNIVVARDRSDASWVEGIVQYHNGEAVVSATAALTKLQKWLLTNKDLPAYDHAMAFISYEMVIHGGSPASGVAPLSGMCNTALGFSTSLIVDKADYRSAYVIAHELGHSLGASHDGTGKNRRCPMSNNYIMSPKAVYAKSTFQNIFTFSTCSLTQMREFLRSPAAACLYDKATPLRKYDVKKMPPGKLISADSQCKMVFGKKSGLCSEPSLKKSLCDRLWCTSPKDKYQCMTHDLLYALPGTTCGIHKAALGSEGGWDMIQCMCAHPACSFRGLWPPAKPVLKTNCQRLRCVMTQSVLPPSVTQTPTSKLTSPPPKQKNSKYMPRRYQTNRRPKYRSLKSVKGVCRDRKIRQCDAVIRAKPSLCRRGRVRKSCCQACRRYYRS